MERELPRRLFALELSTAHLTKEVAQQLDEWIETDSSPGGLTLYPKAEYGWFIPLHDGIILNQLPSNLAYLISFAYSRKAEWIIFDKDVEISDCLPSYDW